LLDIATESRYYQYDLTIEKPKPLVPRAFALHGAGAASTFTARCGFALDEDAVTQRVTALKDNGIDAVAICFHAFLCECRSRGATAAILKKSMPGLRIHAFLGSVPENSRI